MVKYIAFLRAINVGGSKIIKMENLRKFFESMGLTGVATYIQSGNVIFTSNEKDTGKLTLSIEKHLKKNLGYEVEVMLTTYTDLSAVVKDNPFNLTELSESDKLYVAFLASEPANVPDLPLENEKFGITFFKTYKNMIFIIRKPVAGVNGIPNNFFEKQLNAKVTIRNWNTINKIVEKYSG